MPIHEGHRQRLKNQFLTEGLDHFTEIQALELLLFPVVPRRDTNPIAHALLEAFGSFSQVLEAPVEELKKVKGVGDSAAGYLHMVLEAGRYYQISRSRQCRILSSLEKCGEYLTAFFYGKTVENIYLLCLDAKCMVLGCLHNLPDREACGIHAALSDFLAAQYHTLGIQTEQVNIFHRFSIEKGSQIFSAFF